MTTKGREKSSVVNGKGTLTARDANRLNDIYILETIIGRKDFIKNRELFKELKDNFKKFISDIKDNFKKFISDRQQRGQVGIPVSVNNTVVNPSNDFSAGLYDTASPTVSNKPISKVMANSDTQKPTQGRGPKRHNG